MLIYKRSLYYCGSDCCSTVLPPEAIICWLVMALLKLDDPYPDIVRCVSPPLFVVLTYFPGDCVIRQFFGRLTNSPVVHRLRSSISIINEKESTADCKGAGTNSDIEHCHLVLLGGRLIFCAHRMRGAQYLSPEP